MSKLRGPSGSSALPMRNGKLLNHALKNDEAEALPEWERPGGPLPGSPHTGSCWLMQWKEPNPQISSVESTPITRRSENSRCKISSARTSFRLR